MQFWIVQISISISIYFPVSSVQQILQPKACLSRIHPTTKDVQDERNKKPETLRWSTQRIARSCPMEIARNCPMKLKLTQESMQERSIHEIISAKENHKTRKSGNSWLIFLQILHFCFMRKEIKGEYLGYPCRPGSSLSSFFPLITERLLAPIPFTQVRNPGCHHGTLNLRQVTKDALSSPITACSHP